MLCDSTIVRAFRNSSHKHRPSALRPPSRIHADYASIERFFALYKQDIICLLFRKMLRSGRSNDLVRIPCVLMRRSVFRPKRVIMLMATRALVGCLQAAARVKACHSGPDGTGDVAILTAANRMQIISVGADCNAYGRGQRSYACFDLFVSTALT
jgi:hypothetical protein